MQQETPFDGLGEVTYVLLEFGDLNGISRSKQVTVEHFLSNWRDRVVREYFQHRVPVSAVSRVETPNARIHSGKESRTTV